MTSTIPRVSVVMRAYNSAAFIRAAMESILNQTERDLELIIVDGASSDATPDVVNKFARSDTRVRLERQAQRDGVGPALNRGVALARSEYVAIMDADDVAMPPRLARQIAFLQQHAEVGALGGAVQVIDGAGRLIRRVKYPTDSADLARMALYSSPLATPSVMFRKAVFTAVGGCRPVFTMCEDYDLWLRMAERADLNNLSDVLLQYRIHPAQESLASLEVQTLLTHWARVSATERRAGRVDPLDDQTLDLAELRRREPLATGGARGIQALAARANFLSGVGLPAVALQVLALASDVPAQGPARAQMEIAYARAFLGTRKLACAGQAAWQALLSDGPTVARSGVRAILGR